MTSRNPFASVSTGTDAEHTLTPRGNLSYVAGSQLDPLAYITVPKLLDNACDLNGAGEAAIFPEQGVSLSWYSLREQADKFAAGLLSLGIRRGNRVALWSPNRVEWLIAQFGTARIGAILVNINPAYRESELEYALNKVGARVLITARQLKSSNYIDMLQSLAPELANTATTDEHAGEHAESPSELQLKNLPRLKHVILLGSGHVPYGCMRWDFVMQLAGPANQARVNSLSSKLDPDDPINIQFTSGTTGAPKGATLSHFNIVNNARYTAQAMALSATDRVCVPVPLYHCFGMVLGVLSCASVGASMVFPGEAFDANATLRAASHHQCTALLGVPTMFIAMLEHDEFHSHDYTSLRTGIMAGSTCPVDTMQRVIDDMHMSEVTIAYGMTETSPVSFQSNINDSVHHRVSTVGRIHPHVEVKIIDAQGRTVPPGVKGELCTRGYNVMQGYWGESTDTASGHPVDHAGWMHSGDLAILDANGYCSIVGRVKDMIIRGGENIYPREIEEHLLKHPDILDAQVFGIPDEKFGEVVCAWCIVRESAGLDKDGIKTHCANSIAHYKIPAHIRIVSQFPMTVTGKARKVDMRDSMMAYLKLDE